MPQVKDLMMTFTIDPKVQKNFIDAISKYNTMNVSVPFGGTWEIMSYMDYEDEKETGRICLDIRKGWGCGIRHRKFNRLAGR